MGERTIGSLSAADAELVISAYADADELTERECEELGIEEACGDLISVLNGREFYSERERNLYIDESRGAAVAGERDALIDKGYRSSFVNALFGSYGDRPERERIDWLFWALNDDDPFVLESAVYELGIISMFAYSTVPALIDLLGNRHERVRIYVARSLGQMGPFAELAVPALTRALEEDVELVAYHAGIALGKIGQPDEQAILALTKALGDERERVRDAASWGLREIGTGLKPALPALMDALRNGSMGRIRENAAIAIGEIGAEEGYLLTGDDVQALIDALGAEEHEVRAAAAWALGMIGFAAEPAVDDLMRMLGDSRSEVEMNAIWALGEIGIGAKKAIPALLGGLGDGDVLKIEWTAHALSRIDVSSSVELLIGVLSNGDPAKRADVALVLGLLGSDAEQAIPALERAKFGKDELVRDAAGMAIGLIKNQRHAPSAPTPSQ